DTAGGPLPRPAFAVGDREDPLGRRGGARAGPRLGLVEPTVADEVKDVPGGLAHHVEEMLLRLSRYPAEIDPPLLVMGLDRAIDAIALALGVDRGPFAAGLPDHPQDVERTVDRESRL